MGMSAVTPPAGRTPRWRLIFVGCAAALAGAALAHSLVSAQRPFRLEPLEDDPCPVAAPRLARELVAVLPPYAPPPDAGDGPGAR